MSTVTSVRSDVSFPSGKEQCRGWLYRPAASETPPPVIVMAHGLGGVKEMRLDAFAERFAHAGYACVVFDYRNFGASDGRQRQLLSIRSELEDWRSAVRYARSLHGIDRTRVVVWGTSFGGGLALRTAADDGHVAALIAQCPFTDGISSASQLALRTSLPLLWRGVVDAATAPWRSQPLTAATAGRPGTVAFMTGHDSLEGYLALTRHAPTFRNRIGARFALHLPFFWPGRSARRLRCPSYFALCATDTVAPATASVRHARRSSLAQVKLYPYGHFDVYVGAAFELVARDYVAFLHRHVPVTDRREPDGRRV